MSSAKQQTDSFAVIGAGMSGVLAGIKLKQAGHPFTIFEKADRVGGTWREKTLTQVLRAMFHPTYTAIHLNSTQTGANSHPQELKSKNILKESQNATV